MGTYTIAAVGTYPTNENMPPGFKCGLFTLTMSGDYATGGDTADWSSFFPTRVDAIISGGSETANADSGWRLDVLTGTNASPVASTAILVQAWNGTTEAAAMDDLNDVVRRVFVIGK